MSESVSQKLKDGRQFNARLPVDLVKRVRNRADTKGWSVARAM